MRAFYFPDDYSNNLLSNVTFSYIRRAALVTSSHKPPLNALFVGQAGAYRELLLLIVGP